MECGLDAASDVEFGYTMTPGRPTINEPARSLVRPGHRGWPQPSLGWPTTLVEPTVGGRNRLVLVLPVPH